MYFIFLCFMIEIIKGKERKTLKQGHIHDGPSRSSLPTRGHVAACGGRKFFLPIRQKKEILSTRNLSQGEVSGDEERESRKGQGGLSKFIFLIFRFF
jgi:hypothetical protein